MAKTKLRRAIYIGIGGTGIKTILKVKEHFLKSSNGQIPSMIKFLCIDTNSGDLDGRETDEVRLTELEKLHLSVSNPYAQYESGLNEGCYTWMPIENIPSISIISGTGAGQVRSNGRFILEYNQRKDQRISGRINSIYNSLINANNNNNDPNYDLLVTPKTDVYLVFSIAGGTGSGMFIQLASMIKELIPNCNLMVYAYAPSFFENVGVTWNIKHNAYGALLELDYCMQGNMPEYKNLSMGITDQLFDAVMYIDNKTHTDDGVELDSGFTFEEALENIGNALYLSAGQIGTNTASVVDNLRNAMNSGGYNHSCSRGNKLGWVSSAGVSQISCVDHADIESKIMLSSRNILCDLLNGTLHSIGGSTIQSWIDELDINESLGDSDGDKLIDRILPPSGFASPKSSALVVVDQNGVISGLTGFEEVNQRHIESIETNYQSILSEKETEFINKLETTLFPNSADTIGLIYLITIVRSLKAGVTASKRRLEEEIQSYITKTEKINKDIEDKVKEIQHEHNKLFLPANQNTIASCQDTIQANVIELFKNKCQIYRRREANKFYDDFMKILCSYVGDDNGYGKLYELKQHIEAAIERLNPNTGKLSDDTSRTGIDLSIFADKLPTAEAETHPIRDWNELYRNTNYTSLSDLANKQDWDSSIQRFYRQLYPASTSPIIIRILNQMNQKERIDYYQKALLCARPLFNVDNFGEIIKRDAFLFVSVPNEIDDSSFDKLKEEFIEAHKSDRGLAFIKHREGNKIIVYQQVGVIPAFYISGISYTKNNIRNTQSCEYKYREFMSTPNRTSYSPFTDVYFQNAYEKEGHSLDSMHNPQITFSMMELWIDCFIFGLIERKGSMYRMQYDGGILDYESTPVKRWKNLDISRNKAFAVFDEAVQVDNNFATFISNKIRAILSDTNNKENRSKYFGGGEEKENLYISKALIDLRSEEFSNIEVQQVLTRELNFLREHE